MWHDHMISKENKRKKGQGRRVGERPKFQKGGEVTNIGGS